MADMKKEAEVDALLEGVDLESPESDDLVADALRKVYGEEYFGKATAEFYASMTPEEEKAYIESENAKEIDNSWLKI